MNAVIEIPEWNWTQKCGIEYVLFKVVLTSDISYEGRYAHQCENKQCKYV